MPSHNHHLKRILLSDCFFDCGPGESAQQRSEIIDEILGINVVEIERNLLHEGKKQNPTGDRDSWGRSLHDGHQTWVGLHSHTLQTPYAEIVEILKILAPSPDQHFIDLGAGHGRIGLVLHALYPGCSFTGVEFVLERVKEGNRIYKKFDCFNARLIQADISHCDYRLSCADYFFLYDFGNSHEIQKVLQQIKEVMGKNPITVIARGNATRHFVHKEHPWLSDIYRPCHGKNYSVYSNFKDR
ncbi:MAG: methyltransferase domain-containing protein [Bdellovibrio sp.]|nr:methyltransferase domain-containing protein [Bdellovibrio sp.]